MFPSVLPRRTTLCVQDDAAGEIAASQGAFPVRSSRPSGLNKHRLRRVDRNDKNRMFPQTHLWCFGGVLAPRCGAAVRNSRGSMLILHLDGPLVNDF